MKPYNKRNSSIIGSIFIITIAGFLLSAASGCGSSTSYHSSGNSSSSGQRVYYDSDDDDLTWWMLEEGQERSRLRSERRYGEVADTIGNFGAGIRDKTQRFGKSLMNTEKLRSKHSGGSRKVKKDGSFFSLSKENKEKKSGFGSSKFGF